VCCFGDGVLYYYTDCIFCCFVPRQWSLFLVSNRVSGTPYQIQQLLSLLKSSAPIWNSKCSMRRGRSRWVLWMDCTTGTSRLLVCDSGDRVVNASQLLPTLFRVQQRRSCDMFRWLFRGLPESIASRFQVLGVQFCDFRRER
jgi:hypothetical protein